MARPTAVEPVKLILATSGCVLSSAPTTSPLPLTTLNTPAGRCASCSASLSDLRLDRAHLAGLDHDCASGGDGGCELAADESEIAVPRRDGGDHAERLQRDLRTADGLRENRRPQVSEPCRGTRCPRAGRRTPQSIAARRTPRSWRPRVARRARRPRRAAGGAWRCARPWRCGRKPAKARFAAATRGLRVEFVAQADPADLSSVAGLEGRRAPFRGGLRTVRRCRSGRCCA